MKTLTNTIKGHEIEFSDIWLNNDNNYYSTSVIINHVEYVFLSLLDSKEIKQTAYDNCRYTGEMEYVWNEYEFDLKIVELDYAEKISDNEIIKFDLSDLKTIEKYVSNTLKEYPHYFYN